MGGEKNGDKILRYVAEEDLPESLRNSELKPRLAWLYNEVFEEFPIVTTSFADVVISSYSRRYIREEAYQKIDILYRDAVQSQDRFPEVLKEMYEQGRFGKAYQIFRTPACFYLPYLFFEDRTIGLAPYDFLVPRLKASLVKSLSLTHVGV